MKMAQPGHSLVKPMVDVHTHMFEIAESPPLEYK